MGIGMDLEMNQPTYSYDLQIGDFDDIHHSPNYEMLKQHPMINEYIQQQVQLMNKATMKEFEEQKERERDNYEMQKLQIQQDMNMNEEQKEREMNDYNEQSGKRDIKLNQ